MTPRFDTTPVRYHGEVLGMPTSGRVFPITNSERSLSACDRRWWFMEDQGLRSKSSSRPLRLGLAWHEVLEDAHRWWMEFDCALPSSPPWALACPWCEGVGTVARTVTERDPCVRCKGTGMGPLARVTARWTELVGDNRIDGTEMTEDLARLARMIEGWGVVHGGWAPYRAYRVVAVEVSVARPIVDPRTGAAYQPMIPVIEHDDGRRRYARAGEAHKLQVDALSGSTSPHTLRWTRWPWYYIGRLDCVLAERRRPTHLTVGEFKSSANPAKFARDLLLDTQVPGYMWLLEYVCKEGLAPWAVGGVVDGWQYDLTSTSRQREPKPLKKGGLSKAKANTPSWLYRRAVMQQGLDMSEYVEHIAGCAVRVDPKLYHRPFGDADMHDTERVGEELFGFAHHVASMRRTSALAKDQVDLNIGIPRTALCRMPGGSCAFTSICTTDSAEGRMNHFVEVPGWWGDPSNTEALVDDDTMPEEPDEQE